MAREIWKQHLDEAAASLKQRAKAVLIGSINNGQNNTFTGEDDKTIFNPREDETDVERQQKYLTARRKTAEMFFCFIAFNQ